MWSQRKEFCCDYTSTTDAGGPPDSTLFSDHDPAVPVCRPGVRQALRQTTRSTRRRAYSPISVVPDQGKEGVALQLRADGLRIALLLYAYPAPQDCYRTHSVPPARTEAAADFEPRRSPGHAGGAGRPTPSRDAGDSVWVRPPSQ